jgi:tetratricopeptide (TPR) repeat protein
MTQRKQLEGTAASWHPHPKEGTPSGPPDPAMRASNASLAPVVRPADPMEHLFFEAAAPANDEGPAVQASSTRAVSAVAEHDELDELEPASLARQRALQSAPVQARRRYLMRYVASAVGVASVIGVAALVRIALAPAHAADPSTPEVRAAAMAMEAPAPDPAPPAPAPDPAPAADPPPAASAAPAPESPPETTPAPAADPVAAREAKQEAQHAIDRGRVPEAIEAAERSVDLDPTDAEAWLILGAAYQSAGRYTKARHAFSSCKQEATRGPRSECAALLR